MSTILTRADWMDHLILVLLNAELHPDADDPDESVRLRRALNCLRNPANHIDSVLPWHATDHPHPVPEPITLEQRDRIDEWKQRQCIVHAVSAAGRLVERIVARNELNGRVGYWWDGT